MFLVPKIVPSWFKFAEKWTKYVCSKMAASWLKSAQVDPSWPQGGSSSPQVVSKFAQWAKLAPIWWVGDLGSKTNQMRVSISSSCLRLGEIWPQECMKADIDS